jgi:NADPH-dependent 2,4-dienoyl-CoA reductase/sulfur reductase-like enzyme
MKIIKPDILIIGGGAAGMAAAVEGVERNCRTVLVEREDTVGGVLNQCIHNGFGLHVFKQELTGPEYAQLFKKQIEEKGVEVHSCQFVIKVDTKEHQVITMGQNGCTIFQPKALIMTTGARERPFNSLRIPGPRPAGIYTAGVAQRFVNLYNRLPGKRAFVLGSGDIGLIMARRLTLEGMAVLGVAELMPYPGGLARNIAQCLNDFNIPLKLSTSVVSVHGRERLEGITLAKFDSLTFKQLPGTEEYVSCDTLVLSVGLLPQNELIDAFVEMDKVNRGVKVDSFMRTVNPWIFAAGNNVAIYDLVDFVTLDGKIAGQSAARQINKGILPEKKIPLSRDRLISTLIPSFCCKDGEPFTIYLRAKKQIRKGIVKIGPGIIETVRSGIKPSEMVDIHFTVKDLEQLRRADLTQIDVSIEEVQ